MYDDGNTKLSNATLPQVGRAIAKLLELPIAELGKYKDKFVYVQSFSVNQLDMLHSVQKATDTTEKNWRIMKPLL